MTNSDDTRARQVAVMADPERVRLLGLVLTEPSGQVTADALAGRQGDSAAARRHLWAMVKVGLLSHDAGVFRPTHDALARFGSLSGRSTSRAEADYGDHERLLGRIAEELTTEHRGTLAPETVREFVFESYDLLASRAKVRMHLPQLTARFAADRLSALASVVTQDPRARDDVLFVCVKNAGRSQIAAAMMRARAAETVRVRTAGSAPASHLDPVVQAELARIGLADLTEFPRPLTNEVVRASGVVITMGCGDACPIIPGRRYVDWPVADPIGRSAAEVRRIVAEISRRVDVLLSEMGFGPTPLSP